MEEKARHQRQKQGWLVSHAIQRGSSAEDGPLDPEMSGPSMVRGMQIDAGMLWSWGTGKKGRMLAMELQVFPWRMPGLGVDTACHDESLWA